MMLHDNQPYSRKKPWRCCWRRSMRTCGCSSPPCSCSPTAPSLIGRFLPHLIFVSFFNPSDWSMTPQLIRCSYPTASSFFHYPIDFYHIFTTVFTTCSDWLIFTTYDVLIFPYPIFLELCPWSSASREWGPGCTAPPEDYIVFISFLRRRSDTTIQMQAHACQPKYL